MKGVGGEDRVVQAVAQLSTLGEGLQDIRQVLKDGAGSRSAGPVETRFSPETLEQIGKWLEKPKPGEGKMETGLSKATLDRIEKMLEKARPVEVTPMEHKTAGGMTPALAKMLEQQFERLQECVQNRPAEPERILARLERAKRVYDELMDQVGYGGGHDG
ncbi:MAG: hypothetical protein PF795_06095 [Kiritimatiellae bacterium]|jgi:hypothetical protein|nr:hypothetical protein [Kiritimatiellia bacterium]